MAKPKLTLEVSERDKKLLLLLMSVLIIVMAYVFGYQKFTDKTSEYEKELKTLKQKEEDLIEKNENIDEYIEDTEKYMTAYNSIISQYGNEVTQPAVIEFLNRAERITGAWIKSTSFTGTTSVYSFGNLTSSNPELEGVTAYRTDMTAYKTSLTLSYEAEYDKWKELIEFINNYYSKNTIESMSMSYSNITDTVSGTITLSLYSLLDSSDVIKEPEFDIDTGSDNIFYSDKFADLTDEGDGEYILADYDYYMLLNPAASSVDTCIIGANDDKNNASVLSAKSVEVSKAKFTFTGKEGSYTVTYSVDGNEKKYEISSGATLDMLIMSSARLAYDDLTGVELSVVNNTDKTLSIKVANDDKEKPRVDVKSLEGDIVLYN